jgi:hypothetical protein
VNHRVTIRTDRHEIFDRIHLVLALNLPERDDMVYVNKVPPDFPVEFRKVERANGAPIAMVINAPLPRQWISLIGID